MRADRLQQALLALASGDKALARSILRDLILKDPHDGEAWMLMAEAVDHPDRAVECIERALRINPGNKNAREKLSELTGESMPALDRALQETSPFLPDPTLEEMAEVEVDFLYPSKPTSVLSEGSRAKPNELISHPLLTPEKRSYSSKDNYTPKEENNSHEIEGTRRLRNWPLVIGSVLVALTLILAFFGPSLAAKDPLEMSTVHRVGEKYLTPPYPPGTPGYPLGSDSNGRDLLSRMLWGLRPTLYMVLVVAAVRLVLGTLIGMAAGWSKRWFGRALDTAIAAALSIPVIIIALGGIAAIGVDLGIWAFIFGLSVTGWVETARIVREQTQAVRGQVYIEAARALGASNTSILLRHVLQQILSLLWMLFAFEISATLMLTAALGFLGYYIGGDVWVAVTDSTATAISGAPELGQMLATSGVSITKPWGLLVIGGLVFTIVLGFNLLGEGLRKQLSLYSRSGSTHWSRFLADFRFWFEEHIAWPLSNLPRSPAFRPAIGLLMLVIVLAGGLWWGYNRWIGSSDDSSINTVLQLNHLWSSAHRDPFGTRWVQAAGPGSPEIIWTFTDESGFSGGPAVARDGTVYIISDASILYALEASGRTLWQTLLPERPVGSPALGENGDIFIADELGGISAIGADGALIWQFQPEDDSTATTGPVVAKGGSIYYVVQGSVRALNPEGELLWQAHPNSPNTAPSEMVQVSPDGELLFWGDVILDVRDGSILQTETLDHADQYYIGADGKIYQIEDHDVIQWDGVGVDASSGARLTWEHSKFTIARTPEDAGTAPDGVVWLFYTGFARGYGFGEDTRVVWIGANGDLLGNAFHPIRDSQVIGIDEEHILYVCGNIEQGYGDPQCGALSPDSEAAIWTLNLEDSQRIAGGALIPGRLYIASHDGKLYALGIPESLPVQEEDPGQILTQPGSTTEPNQAETGSLEEESQQIGPKDGSFRMIFEDKAGFTGGPAVGDEGYVYLLSKAGSLYALSPGGDLKWEVSLPAAPVGTPLAGIQGVVYVSDKEGALSAYSPTGDIIWRFTPQGEFKAISGPAVGPDGSLYYTLLDKKATIQAVSSEGEGLWMAEVKTSLFYHTPEVSLDGDFIFFQNEVFDAQAGRPLEFNLDFEVDEFFGGEDGGNYLRSDNTIVEWEPAGSGITLAEERVLVPDDHRGEPNRAFVSSRGIVWLYYNNAVLWFTKEGEALGTSSPEDSFLTQPVAIDLDSSVYICGRRPVNLLRDPKPMCFSLSVDDQTPQWETKLSEKGEKVNGGALVSEALYITTEEGRLYLIGNAQVDPVGLASEEVSLLFEVADGFSGAPAVAENGALFISSKNGRLYSIDSKGGIIWEAALPADPVDHPTLGPLGNVYLTLEDGSLSTYSPAGDLIWHYKPEGDFKAVSGAAIANNGTVYYTLLGDSAMIHAVSPTGEGLWLTQLQTPLFYRTPQVSVEENYIFFRDEVFDARNGEALNFDLDFQVDEFFSGQDGRNYLRTGGTIAAWESAGTSIILAEERVLSAQGLPDGAGVSSQGVVWLRYDNQFFWYTRKGEALGTSETSRRFFDHFISVDAESRIYTCGEHARPTCYALSWDSDVPIWQAALGDDFQKIAGSAFRQEKIYIATEEGHLYVLGGVK